MISSNLISTKIPVRYAVPLLLICTTLMLSAPESSAQDLDVPFVPTPQETVEKMLDLVNVNSSDYVIDLGSGDGRIVITAAKRGAAGHGIDLDPERIAEARGNAQEANVADQIMFMKQNIFETDFSKASIITMYLLPSVNKKLRPKLLDNLEPGTQIVSHSFDMGDWEPDKKSDDVYYWVIPAKVDGSWSWSANGQDFTMDIDQKYQKITVNLSDGNSSSYNIQKANLQGERISLRVTNGSQHYIFSGRVKGDQITGAMQRHNGDDQALSSWTANRQ